MVGVLGRLLLMTAAMAAMGCGGPEPKRDPPPPTNDERARPPAVPSHVGTSTCARCHPSEAQAHAASHHARAMAPATPESVLGKFDGATLDHDGTTARFLREGERFVVELSERGAAPVRHEVAFTFGVEPLQQLLVPADAGRHQALRVAWDTRPADAGGQRWFHLLSGERIGPDDPLHWSGALSNWNHQCADCHSTGVRRGWDDQARRYDTTYDEVDVGCEACHGPGSLHAEPAGGTRPPMPWRVAAPSPRVWALRDGEDIATLASAPAPVAATETCAPCHSRRDDLGPAAGDRWYHDRYRLSLLRAPLYFPDGQIQDEVFVHGSFVQSKMYAAGVVCADCHDPHGGQPRRPGNQLCTECHRPERFDSPEHHFHAEGQPGSACVDCHMPARTYMEVDGRRDHRFGVPRPALTASLGTPNACDGCHADRGSKWAADVVAKRAGTWKPPSWPEHLAAGRSMDRDGLARLATVTDDETLPPIVRASAVAELGAYLSPRVTEILTAQRGDPSPLVRRAVADAAPVLPPAARVAVVGPLLTDPIRSVRAAAGRALLEVDAATVPAQARAALGAAIVEFEAGRRYDSDRAEGLVDLAHLAALRGETEKARALLERAVETEPSFTAAHVNLADLHRALGDEAAAEAVLRGALGKTADEAAIEHALGLALVRRKDKAAALLLLRRAHERDPGSSRYGYVYAVALAESDLAGAIELLEELVRERPGDARLTAALADYRGRIGGADR